MNTSTARQLVILFALFLLAGCDASADGGADGALYGPTSGGAADFAYQQPGDNSGDNYEAVGTNPYTMTSHDPLSTFSVDVDTASYDIFRRDINDGTLPQPDSVRVEEYVNAFEYDYPIAAHDVAAPFAIHLDGAPNPFRAGTALFRVGIQGKAAPPEGEQRPANLVFLIDVSGSMSSADKLPLVQTVLRETLEVLAPNDTVSIVTYAGSTGVRLEPTPVSESGEIRRVIDDFSAGGSTAGAAGLDLAYQQAEAAFVEGGINHVLICSDGDFNVGPSSTEELVSLIESKRATGITLTALGFGVGNLNDAMMEAISNKGNGVYGVISDEDHAISYVHDRMLSTMHFIAKDVKIQVEFNAEHVLAYRLIGYENRDISDNDFTNDAIDASEIGAGHTVTALYELVLADGVVPTVAGAPEIVDGGPADVSLDVMSDELALVKVRYKEVDAAADAGALQVDASMEAAGLGNDFEAAAEGLRWAAAVAAFAEIVKEGPYGDPLNLTTIAATVDALNGDGARADRREFDTLLGTALSLLD